MSLNREEVNPLSVLGLRKLNFIPEHFTKIKIDKFVDLKLLDHWINYNLNSRYAIIRGHSVDVDNKINETIEVGIEDPRDLTLLTLGCPLLHK